MADIYTSVTERIKMLGYNTSNDDSFKAAVTYSINRAAEEIKANINRTEIPEGLFYTHVDMAAGLFLKEKKDCNQLGEAFDFSAPAKSISEGDVSITFAGVSDGSSTPEARFNEMLHRLINPPKSIFATYRRLKW